MTLKQYDNYKPSGVEWLGEIPRHWEVKRVKDVIAKIGSGVTPKGGSEVYVEKGITFLRSQNVYDDGLRLDDVSFITEETNSNMKNSQLRPFDILINITGASIARTCIVPENLKKANINQHIIYLRIKKRQVDFLSNYIKSPSIKDYIMLVQAGTSKEALNMGQTLNIPILLPPRTEQTDIAHYLDQKTTAIDRKIDLLEKKIDRYQALRKSLINETVCRGLDKSVKLKDSGIEWIGQVPEHWQPVRLKDIGFLYSGLSGKSGDDFNQEDNLNNRGFIPFTNIANNIYLDKNQLGTVIVFDNEKQNQVRKNDLFFLMSSEGYADIGKTAVLADEIKETYLNSFCKGFRISNKNNDSYFINYLLLSPNYRHSMIVEGKGFTRINLKMEKVNDYFIYTPPSKAEQTAIATYLDDKTQKIDPIISNIKKQIEVLKELRKTLINDVVTGKIRVNN